MQPIDTTLNLVDTRLSKHSCPKSSSVLTELNVLCYHNDGMTTETDGDLTTKLCELSDSAANTNSGDNTSVAQSSSNLDDSKDVTAVHENTSAHRGEDTTHRPPTAEQGRGHLFEQRPAGTGAVPSPHEEVKATISSTDISYVKAPMTSVEEQTFTEDMATSELLYIPVESGPDHPADGNCHNTTCISVQHNSLQKSIEHPCTLSFGEGSVISPISLKMDFDLPLDGDYSELCSPISLSPVDESSISCSYVTQDSCNHATDTSISKHVAGDQSVMPTAVSEEGYIVASDVELCTDRAQHSSQYVSGTDYISDAQTTVSSELLLQPTKLTQPNTQQCSIASMGYLSSDPTMESSRLPLNGRNTHSGQDSGVGNDAEDSNSFLPTYISSDTPLSSWSVSSSLGGYITANTLSSLQPK